MLEKRQYNEDSTPYEIELIRSRTFLYEEGIIRANELPVVSPFTITLCFDKIEELAQSRETFALIIDLRDSARPDAKGRRVLNERFMNIASRLSHCSYITGKNAIINTAIRFVMYGTGLKSFSVDSDEETAIKKLKDAIGKTKGK